MQLFPIILQSIGALWLSAGWAAAGIIINPYAFGGGPPEPAWIIQQGFEGSGYDHGETWTAAGTGSVDPDSTAVVLEGTQSLRIQLTSQSGSTYREITADGSLYVRMMFRMDSAANGVIATIRTANTLRATLSRISNKLRVQASGGSANDSTDDLPTGTTLYLWVEYISGSGSDAIARAGWSATPTKPTLSASGSTTCASIDGTGTGTVNRLYLGTTASTPTFDVVYDQVRGLNSAF